MDRSSFAIPALENPALAARIAARWNNLTKPPGSLGRLEEIVTQYALIRGDALPRLARKTMYVFCADHGVTEEGVSAFPAEVTALMVDNFLRGGAAISVLCRRYGIETRIVDCGVRTPSNEPGVIDVRIGPGTRNFAREAAMTREHAERAIGNGVALARAAAAGGCDVAGIGEMGIGNTTAASALLSVFAGLGPAECTGRGAGLDGDGVARKTAAIAKALLLHKPDPRDPVAALAAVGGFEIATMTGFLLGAAACRLPVVVDGFIATSAALAAAALAPAVTQSLLFAHRSAERAHGLMLAHLNVRPMLDLDLRLGEGSAAAIGIDLLACGLQLYREMATFDDLHAPCRR